VGKKDTYLILVPCMKLSQTVTEQKKFTEVLLSPETKCSANKPKAVNFSEWQESCRLNNEPTVTRPRSTTLINKLTVTQLAGKFPPFTQNPMIHDLTQPITKFN
jgi:hypothetical protein